MRASPQCLRVRKAAKTVLEGREYRHFFARTDVKYVKFAPGVWGPEYGDASAYFELPSQERLADLQRNMPQGYTARAIYTYANGWVSVVVETARITFTQEIK